MNSPFLNGQETVERSTGGRFAPGNKASPGRPPGRGVVAELRDKLATDLDQIIDNLKAQALAGDKQAIRIIFDRVMPTLRPVDLPAVLALPAEGTLTQQARAGLCKGSQMATWRLRRQRRSLQRWEASPGSLRPSSWRRASRHWRPSSVATLERRVAAMERKGDDAYWFPPLSPGTLARLRRLKSGQCATDEQPLAATASGAAIAKRGAAPKLSPATRALLKELREHSDARAVTAVEQERDALIAKRDGPA